MGLAEDEVDGIGLFDCGDGEFCFHDNTTFAQPGRLVKRPSCLAAIRAESHEIVNDLLEK
jgi:hypothetical protein